MVYKIIVIGDPMVGKTSLLTKFATDRFEEIYLPTIGANITKKVLDIDGGRVSLMLWDIAGQKDFYEIYKSYFNGANAIIIVFDITRKETFSNVKLWYGECIDNGIGHAPIILVGNKSDLYDREITVSNAMAHGEMFNAKYFETSALTGKNVDAVFKSSARLACENIRT
jgi:small GTP-binding protein